MNAADMISACFAHQHPEAFGRAVVLEEYVPYRLRAGDDFLVSAAGEVIPAEAMGDPDALPIHGD